MPLRERLTLEELTPGAHYWAVRKPYDETKPASVVYIFSPEQNSEMHLWRVEELAVAKTSTVGQFAFLQRIEVPDGVKPLTREEHIKAMFEAVQR